jgi:3-hydroxymyristoyl/3-hydroxydecanoyl-(acyl carrier protein) dehydratase
MSELPVQPRDQLHGLDKCTFSPDGGRYGKGYIYGEAKVDPNAWFFKYHFYQDPVMPGSLGVDLIYQSLELSMRNLLESDNRARYVGQDMRLSYDSKHEVTWMYRGQVKPSNQMVSVELHIKELIQDASGITSIAEASLWVDGLRIYSVNDLMLRLTYTRDD